MGEIGETMKTGDKSEKKPKKSQSLGAMWEMAVNLIIRPERADYSVACLGPDSFAVGGREFVREELELQNGRHLMLQCSWYRPRETSPAPCIVYLHGNSGCRADADDA